MNLNIDFKHHIQSLRGISVILVIFYHLNIDYFSKGYLGVDIFDDFMFVLICVYVVIYISCCWVYMLMCICMCICLVRIFIVYYNM